MSTLERNVRGLLGTKLGMTQTWDENNRVVPVTVVAAGTNVVTQVRRPDTDGGRHGERTPQSLDPVPHSGETGTATEHLEPPPVVVDREDQPVSHRRNHDPGG